MRTYTSKGTICVPGPYNLEYSVATIYYHLNEDGSFLYEFEPHYSVISLLEEKYFQGIPGLDLELKKPKYVRENRTPTFISERVPEENREDYQELLEATGLEYMDPIEYLIRTNLQYFGDNLYVTPYRDAERFELEQDFGKLNTFSIIRETLQHINHGDEVIFNGQTIDDSNRKLFHDLFLFLYAKSFNARKEAQAQGISKAKKEGKYKGRRPKHVDLSAFLDFEEKIKQNKLTTKEAAEKLGINLSKYYRLRKGSASWKTKMD